jgi:hypothetical protein
MAMVFSFQPPKETQGQKPLQTPQSQNEGSKNTPQLTATVPPLLPSILGLHMGATPYNREWQGEVGFHSHCQT